MKKPKSKTNKRLTKRLSSILLTSFLLASTTIGAYASTPENQVPTLDDFPTGQHLIPGNTGGYIRWVVPKSGLYRLVVQGGFSAPSTRVVGSQKEAQIVRSGSGAPPSGTIDLSTRSWDQNTLQYAPLQGRTEVLLTRGQILHLFIGGNSTFSSSNGVSAGGYNGGGNGHTPITIPADRLWSLSGVKHRVPNTMNFIQSGGGGGATDIRLNADPNDPSKYLKHILVSSPSAPPVQTKTAQSFVYQRDERWSTDSYGPYLRFVYYNLMNSNNQPNLSSAERIRNQATDASNQFILGSISYSHMWFPAFYPTNRSYFNVIYGTWVNSYQRNTTINLGYAGGTFNNLNNFINSLTPARYGFINSAASVTSTEEPVSVQQVGGDRVDGSGTYKYHVFTAGHFGGIINAGLSETAAMVGFDRLAGGKTPDSTDTIWPSHPNRPGISWAFRRGDPSVPDIPMPDFTIPNMVPPQIEVVGTPITTPTRNNITLTLRATDDETPVGSLEYLNVPGLSAPALSTVGTARQAIYTITQNGTYTFRVKDADGNVGTYTHTVTNIDKENPTLTTRLSTNLPTNQNIFIELEARDNVGVEGIYNSANVKIGTSGASVEISSNGTQTFRVRDLAGNETMVNVPVNNIDKQAPSPPILEKVGTNQFTIKPNGDNMTPDDQIRLQYSINGGNWLSFLGSPIDIPEGNYNIRGKAIDRAGNESITSGEGNLAGSYSNEHPNISIVSQPTTPTQSTTRVNLRAMSNDSVGIRSIKISSPSGSNMPTEITIPNAESRRVTDFRFSFEADRNGKYIVTAEKYRSGEEDGLKANLEVNVSNIDTSPPTANISTSDLLRVSPTQTRLNVNPSNVYDDLTPTNRLRWRVQGGTGNWATLSSNTVINHSSSTESITIEIQDESGRVTTVNNLSLPTLTNSVPGQGEEGSHIGRPNDPTTPQISNTLEKLVPIPDIGTHYQLSHDNINWGDWEERNGMTEVGVTLPSGDGIKNVYVRTGFAEDRTQAIFNSITGEVQNVPTGDIKISPLNNTIKASFMYDLTPPTLQLKTRDNLWIANEQGNLSVEVEVIDNLDREPSLSLTLTNHAGTAIWQSPSDLKMPEDRTTFRITVGEIFRVENDTQNRGYTLRVEARDRNGNLSVKTQTIYGRHFRP